MTAQDGTPRLVAISCEGYKAFRQRERLAVRPLTILIGRNSAGKSALARLPVLLRRSLAARARGPLTFAGDDIDFGASFLDVVNDRVSTRPIGLGIEWIDEES